MSTIDTSFVMLMFLVVLDLALFGAVVFFIRNVKISGRNEAITKAADLLETLVIDSGKVAAQWRGQIEQKQDLARQMNEELDQKFVSLKLLCSRAEALARNSRTAERTGSEPVSLTGRERKIISLARKGRRTEEIADQLEVPEREVDLVLGLEKKLSRLGAEKRLS
jgi:DNA-binding NarL/FixJ family response regulator